RGRTGDPFRPSLGLGRSRFSRASVRPGADFASRYFGLCFGRIRQDGHLRSRFPASGDLGPCAAPPRGLVWLYVLEASSESALSTGRTRWKQGVEQETPKAPSEAGLTKAVHLRVATLVSRGSLMWPADPAGVLFVREGECTSDEASR